MQAIFGNVGSLGANIPQAGSNVQTFGLELVLVSVFFFVILNVSEKGSLIGKHAGIAVGATFVATTLVAGPITTVSFNIARAVAPAALSGNERALNALWAYIVASVVAAFIAALLQRLFRDVKQGEKAPLAKAIECREKEVASRGNEPAEVSEA